MRTLICGTVPDDAFPLCMGTWKVEDGRLVPVDVKVCGEGELPPAVPVERGTPALAAAAILALEALGGEAPLLLLAGDCGSSQGSTRLYAHLASWLGTPDAETLGGLTFHYLFPSVDGHNRILMALEERKRPMPVLIADAGFMYAAKMSGYASRYDVFTPDAGELAFLADEKAPHPFYTRGFLLAEGRETPELAGLAWEHGDSARLLLVKGAVDMVVEEGRVCGRVDSPCIPFMEPVGGTGDLVAGLLTAFAAADIPLKEACLLAAQGARFTGELTKPTPATGIAAFMPFVGRAAIMCRERLTSLPGGRI